MVVMLGDRQQAFARDAAAPGDVFKKRQNILTALRSAEPDNQDRVVAASAARLGR